MPRLEIPRSLYLCECFFCLKNVSVSLLRFSFSDFVICYYALPNVDILFVIFNIDLGQERARRQ